MQEEWLEYHPLDDDFGSIGVPQTDTEGVGEDLPDGHGALAASRIICLAHAGEGEITHIESGGRSVRRRGEQIRE